MHKTLSELLRSVCIEGLAAFTPKNSLNEDITPADQRRVPVPSTLVSGDPIIIGSAASDPLKGLPGVAITSYDSRDGMATITFVGAHRLTVTFQSGCPQVAGAIYPGQPLYAAIYEAGATYNAATRSWTGFKIDANNGGVPFGSYFEQAASAASGSATASVRLNRGGV